MSERRVVITGLGIISPVGSGLKKNWQNIVDGKSGITKIDRFDASDYPCQLAGQVDDFNVTEHLSAKEARRMDRFIQLGLVASMEAVENAGLDLEKEDLTRIGTYIGSGIGGVETIENTTLEHHQKGPKRVSPFYVPMSIINMISGNLSIMYNFKGPNLSMVTACTTATHSIGDAARLIEYGDADVMIAGGAEAGITPTAIAGFGNARALTRRNEEPQAASRPWDMGRDGFVMGEGAGIVVLEELQHAKSRGAKIYAELAGFGMSADAYHMTAPLESGEGASRCMNVALKNARINPEQIDYINAHGTSTPLGDLAETQAIKLSFTSHASRLAVSSTKSMTGHLLGAAGGIEAIYCCMAIQDQVLPPTINLHDQDPACDLDYVANESRAASVKTVLSNSFGFGGTNGTLVFKKFD